MTPCDSNSTEGSLRYVNEERAYATGENIALLPILAPLTPSLAKPYLAGGGNQKTPLLSCPRNELTIVLVAVM
jgi:hypothetical protein